MNYGRGDKVVCIDSMPAFGGMKPPLKLGKTYIVESIPGPQCVNVVGVLHEEFGMCGVCKVKDRGGHFWPWRFVKLDDSPREIPERELAEMEGSN